MGWSCARRIKWDLLQAVLLLYLAVSLPWRYVHHRRFSTLRMMRFQSSADV
jgi:hypothetical protein